MREENTRKLRKLKQELSSMGSLVIAFSGGVDSSFLASIAYEVLGDKALSMTFATEVHSRFEVQEARKIAEEIGIPHRVIKIKLLDNRKFKENSPLRCYFCKKALFSRLKKIAKERGYKHVACGENVEDETFYRPGMKACRELNISTPLINAGLTKQDIRELSRERNLSTWNKPSLSCLATRIPYHMPILPRTLSMIEESEDFIRQLGISQFRVRHHGDTARIEVLPDDMRVLTQEPVREKVIKRLGQIGYTYISLDLKGYRTGSMDKNGQIE
jgi:uncharacterized protein